MPHNHMSLIAAEEQTILIHQREIQKCERRIRSYRSVLLQETPPKSVRDAILQELTIEMSAPEIIKRIEHLPVAKRSTNLTSLVHTTLGLLVKSDDVIARGKRGKRLYRRKTMN